MRDKYVPALVLARAGDRTRRLAYYGIPILFCLILNLRGFRTWFYSDDFAWLGLRLEVHSFRDLLGVLFRPEAQGTVRTLSERLFFLTFSSVFGLHAEPFKCWVFFTQFANLVLLAQITRRITGSATAGFLACMLWSANAGVALSLTLLSVYNEVAFAFFILLAFRLFLKYIDTGRTKYWIWQWVVFLLGFGALELNAVYPAIAAGYAFFCARRHFRKTLYLFIPSIAFALLHFVLIARPDSEAYRMYFGANLGQMLWAYLQFALGATRDTPVDWRPVWLGRLITIATLSALLIFAVQKLRRHQVLPLLTFLWFFVVILPLLPLKNHFTEYYVTVPVVGFAMLGGWALASARGPALIVAGLLTGACLTANIAEMRSSQGFYYENARKMKHLLREISSVERAHPCRTFLVQNVDTTTFWLGFYHDPFRLVGVTKIYLVPGSEKAIDPHPEIGSLSRFTIGLEKVVELAGGDEVVVFALRGHLVNNITRSYIAQAFADFAGAHPEYIDVGNPIYNSRLGPSWYQIENRFRWMPKSATVRIGGLFRTGQKLKVTGYCPASLPSGPANVSFRANGIFIGTAQLAPFKGKEFAFEFLLPGEVTKRSDAEITIETNYTFQAPGDTRQLGLIFGTFRVE